MKKQKQDIQQRVDAFAKAHGFDEAVPCLSICMEGNFRAINNYNNHFRFITVEKGNPRFMTGKELAAIDERIEQLSRQMPDIYPC